MILKKRKRKYPLCIPNTGSLFDPDHENNDQRYVVSDKGVCGIINHKLVGGRRQALSVTHVL